MNLHPAQSASVVVPNATLPLRASLDVPLVTLTAGGNGVMLTAAQQTGRATLTIVDAAGATVQIPVRVAYDAGTVAPSAMLQVTGNPIDPLWLQTQVQNAIARATQTQPGAVAKIGPLNLPAALAPGTESVIPVPVQIPGGDQYYDVNGTTNLTLRTIAADAFAPGLLFYDDDPERINAAGVLYRGTVSSSAPSRLYYYHQNTAQPRRLLVVLTATAAASVQVIDASAGPNIDVMSVGHAVSRDFLLRKPRNEGIVLDLGEAPYVLRDVAMRAQDGAAGSIGFRLMSGGPVTVTVLAVDPAATAADITTALAQPPLPGDGHHRTGVFDISAYGRETIAYTAGGPDASTQYGATTPPAMPGSPPGRDYGDYGVMRTIVFDAANPGQAPVTVYLYERPLGGPVRSSFLVDGALVQLGCARLPQPYQIGTPFSLPPGSRSQITLQTMTDGGSNYPLEVGLTATPPQPVTPPISAPDGCFPKPVSAPMPSAVPVPEPSGRF